MPTDRIHLKADSVSAPRPDPNADKTARMQEATNRILAAGFARLAQLPTADIAQRSAMLAVAKVVPTIVPAAQRERAERLQSRFNLGGPPEPSLMAGRYSVRPPAVSDAAKMEERIGSAFREMLTGFKTTLVPALSGAAGRRSAGEGGGMGNTIAAAFSGVFSVFTAKLFLLIAPIVSFGTVLTAATSGFQTFLSAVSLLGASIAPILFPVMMGLAAAVVTASDILWQKLIPVLPQFYAAVVKVMTQIVEAVERIAKKFGFNLDIAPGKPAAPNKPAAGGDDGMKNWQRGPDGNWVPKKQPAEPGVPKLPFGHLPAQPGPWGIPIPAPGDKFRNANWLHGLPIPDAKPGAKPDAAQKDEPNPFADVPLLGAKPGGGLADKFLDNLKESLIEFKMRNGPKAQYSSLVQQSRNVQLAALNASPYEQKMQQRIDEVINALWRVVENTGKQMFVG